MKINYEDVITIDKRYFDPNDIIIIYYELGTFTIGEMNNFYQDIKSHFPHNDVIAVPKNYSLFIGDKEAAKEALEAYLEDLE